MGYVFLFVGGVGVWLHWFMQCPLLRVLFGDSVRSDESLIAVMHDMREYVCEAAKSSCNAIHRHFSRSRCLSSGSHALVEVPDLPESGFYLDKRCLHL